MQPTIPGVSDVPFFGFLGLVPHGPPLSACRRTGRPSSDIRGGPTNQVAILQISHADGILLARHIFGIIVEG